MEGGEGAADKEGLMAHIGLHPAPGLGELIPGWFVLPSNPISPAGRIPSMGELLPATFPIPQNPLVAAIMAPRGGCGLPGARAGMGDLGSDCGCIGGMCGCGMSGLGQFDMLTMALVAGGLVLLWMVMAPGGSEYKKELRAARTAYEDRVARARGEHRGYKRAARGTAKRIRSGLAATAGEWTKPARRGAYAFPGMG